MVPRISYIDLAIVPILAHYYVMRFVPLFDRVCQYIPENCLYEYDCDSTVILKCNTSDSFL